MLCKCAVCWLMLSGGVLLTEPLLLRRYWWVVAVLLEGCSEMASGLPPALDNCGDRRIAQVGEHLVFV